MAAVSAVWSRKFCNFELLNSAYITLLPKKDDAASIKDYRPISLVHSFAKLITKLLANRLAVAGRLDQLVSPNESATQGAHDERTTGNGYDEQQTGDRWLRNRRIRVNRGRHDRRTAGGARGRKCGLEWSSPATYGGAQTRVRTGGRVGGHGQRRDQRNRAATDGGANSMTDGWIATTTNQRRDELLRAAERMTVEDP